MATFTDPVLALEATNGTVTSGGGILDLGTVYGTHATQWEMSTTNSGTHLMINLQILVSMTGDAWAQLTTYYMEYQNGSPVMPYSEINYIPSPARYVQYSFDVFEGDGTLRVWTSSTGSVL